MAKTLLSYNMRPRTLLLLAITISACIASYFYHRQLRPPELWRGVFMELPRAVLLMPNYEVNYDSCEGFGETQGSVMHANYPDNITVFGGGYEFPALNNNDAYEFAANARPGCQIRRLNRIDHHIKPIGSAKRIHERRTALICKGSEKYCPPFAPGFGSD